MFQIEVKRASLLNLDVLQKLSIQTFSETFADANSAENIENYINQSFNLQQLTAELSNPESRFFIAYENEKPVGYLKLNSGAVQTEKLDITALEIHRIYVLKTYHGKQIGQILLNKAKQEAIKSGKSYMWLGVWEKNHRALAFYTKNGFVTFDTHVFTLGDENQTDLLMKLEIKNI